MAALNSAFATVNQLKCSTAPSCHACTPDASDFLLHMSALPSAAIKAPVLKHENGQIDAQHRCQLLRRVCASAGRSYHQWQ